ncbi:hypothetical protein PF007_g28979 [Phytophthora fragariae]|uniref:Uncharacterized protein n=1 Tax=Phytophthora fragariae TaxID=53985 RepID=A0A6A3PYA8_9STRA|nr:hypothetical protein PF007_g28979 [Phytophthora fragariae]
MPSAEIWRVLRLLVRSVIIMTGTKLGDPRRGHGGRWERRFHHYRGCHLFAGHFTRHEQWDCGVAGSKRRCGVAASQKSRGVGLAQTRRVLIAVASSNLPGCWSSVSSKYRLKSSQASELGGCLVLTLVPCRRASSLGRAALSGRRFLGLVWRYRAYTGGLVHGGYQDSAVLRLGSALSGAHLNGIRLTCLCSSTGMWGVSTRTSRRRGGAISRRLYLPALGGSPGTSEKTGCLCGSEKFRD